MFFSLEKKLSSVDTYPGTFFFQRQAECTEKQKRETQAKKCNASNAQRRLIFFHFQSPIQSLLPPGPADDCPSSSAAVSAVEPEESSATAAVMGAPSASATAAAAAAGDEEEACRQLQEIILRGGTAAAECASSRTGVEAGGKRRPKPFARQRLYSEKYISIAEG